MLHAAPCFAEEATMAHVVNLGDIGFHQTLD
jgi:hypothetical protein